MAGVSPGSGMTLIACPDCAAIQRMPSSPAKGWVECWRCGHVLERTAGRSVDVALACALATLLLLIPANFMSVMTVRLAGITSSTHLASGLVTSWRQGWPLLAVVMGLLGIVLPFVRFGLLAVTLGAIRFGVRGHWLGPAFRLCQKLDLWAMADVVLIGAGIGYGRVSSQIPVHIDIGGWCFVAAAVMTMVTRASLERRAIWRRLPGTNTEGGTIACTSCDLVLSRDAQGGRCPRCAAPVHWRRPFALMQCTALLLACWFIMPAAYGLPMSAFWKFGEAHPHTVIEGIELLFHNGFWPFGVVLVVVSIGVPFAKLIILSWLLAAVRWRWSWWLRRRTRLYRLIDEAGRWSNLDPFTVMVFAPMIQFDSIAHFDVRIGSTFFLASVVLSMLATRVFDPRLMWDAAEAGGAAPDRSKHVPANEVSQRHRKAGGQQG